MRDTGILKHQKPLLNPIFPAWVNYPKNDSCRTTAIPNPFGLKGAIAGAKDEVV